MGSGIAQVAAQAGFRTVLREVSDALGQRARAGIEKTLAKGIERGKVAAEARDSGLGRRLPDEELARQIARAQWDPHYYAYRAHVCAQAD